MGHADNYVGLMKRIQFERFQNVYGALSTAIVSGTTNLARIYCSAYAGVTIPKGAKITIAKPYTTTSLVVTTNEEVVAGKTYIDIETITANADYPVGSTLVIDNSTLAKDRYRRYFTTHLNGTFSITPSTKMNDYLGTLSQGTFTSDGGSVFHDGDNKGNNFGGRYGMLNSFGTDFKIHEIKTNIITDLPGPTNVTLSFWKKSFDPTGSSNSTINLVCQNTLAAGASFNQGYQFHNTRLEATTNGQFTANDVLIPTIRQNSQQRSNFNVYFDTQVICSTLFN